MIAALAVAALFALGALSGPAAPVPADRPTPSLAFRSDPERRAVLLKTRGANDEVIAAVTRGLAWLAGRQADDGRWVMDGRRKDDVAATGVALLALLGAGESPSGKGKYAKTVKAGLAWLESRQSAKGEFASGSSGPDSHAIATQAVCEAYGLTGDPERKPPARKALDSVIEDLSDAPGTRGDTAVFGWQVQALHAGREVGLDIPTDTLRKADRFLDSVMTPEGGYGHTPKQESPNLTAVGAYCRQVLGTRTDDETLLKTIDRVKQANPDSLKTDDNMRCFYYATRALADAGGDDWDISWNPRMRDRLIRTQRRQPVGEAGSWDEDGELAFGHGTGRVFNTAVCVLTLEVYYRYPPPKRAD